MPKFTSQAHPNVEFCFRLPLLQVFNVYFILSLLWQVPTDFIRQDGACDMSCLTLSMLLESAAADMLSLCSPPCADLGYRVSNTKFCKLL